MKKHLFGLLALLLLLALTACSSGSSSSDDSSSDDVATIPNGYYVYFEGEDAYAYINISGSSMAFYETNLSGQWVTSDETCSHSLSGNKIMVEGVQVGTYDSSSRTITFTEGGNSMTLVYRATLPEAAYIEPSR
ncbi:MAG: hypothetical protein II039_07730 [Treponema sp.]|nr:hypothetical protein [Treponema sp.]